MIDMLRLGCAALFALTGLAAQSAQLAVAGMPDDAPLAVTASHDGSKLRIVTEIQKGWHLYGRDVGGGKPVDVKITGGAFAAAGTLATPMDKDGLITCTAELTLPLRRTGAGDALAATMSFMVCDALRCLPPIVLELRTAAATATAPASASKSGAPMRVLLVATDEGERTQRIAGFLRDRGCVPTVTTYAAVTTALCDQHDVVIADSETFMAVRGKKVSAETFRKSQSPVVAVGFLGTRVLEDSKVSMACGYI